MLCLLAFMYSSCGANQFESDSGTGILDYTSKSSEESDMLAPPPPPVANENLSENEPLAEKIEKKIIKTADITLEVRNLRDSRQAIEKTISKYKAYISEEKESNSSSNISTSLIIRIASEKFDSLVNDISTIAKNVDSKNISLSDVTEEFIDIQARLKNKKEVEKQYQEILKKARTIDEILQVNEHLRRVREEIESQEGRLKYLENKVSLSTINLYMYQKTEEVYRGYGHKLIDGFEGGWKGILAFLVGLTYIWPILIIIFAAIWYFRRRRKNKLNKGQN
jgi:type III secretory pathway component EscV